MSIVVNTLDPLANSIAAKLGKEPLPDGEANKVKFVRPLKSREKQNFSYELTTRLGTNATR